MRVTRGEGKTGVLRVSRGGIGVLRRREQGVIGVLRVSRGGWAFYA